VGFNINRIPTEYEIVDGTKTVRMVKQTDYAELKSAYVNLLWAMENIKAAIKEFDGGF
jgi:hypothetical protein